MTGTTYAPGSRAAAAQVPNFLYDGDVPLCELNSSGSVTATNCFGPTSLLSRRSGASSVFYAFDPSGNLAQRIDTEANVLASVRFDAYGTKSGTDASPDPYSGFGGQYGYYTDTEDGLTLLGERYYDTGTGRFVNRDPIGYDGGINLYGYVGNNPVDWGDPDGLAPSRGPGTKSGPGDTKYRIDWHEQPSPDMHIWHSGGETNVTHQGGWRRGIHHGERMTSLPKSLRKPHRGIISDFCKRALKFLPDVPPQLEIFNFLPVIDPDELYWLSQHPGTSHDDYERWGRIHG